MASVWILVHIQELDGDKEDEKLVGVYSSRTNAEAAISRMSLLAGFRDHLEGFEIEEYELDRDHWTDGFSTSTGKEEVQAPSSGRK
jgi:hypothetical protein